ncbi:hypothetical protein [Actomonas aquatica]|uniref:DUF4375 domain-containing protein n=1 Tax=Actomonas aquatica TaxID=2866162 RepID=A0ABZ1C9C5_9BACT|nr:hypothetical protein [Opitutus sp. WL0086]WRQ88240.1 hypothetical protein K1X11_002400 [Opitutus sp. WL0086]
MNSTSSQRGAMRVAILVLVLSAIANLGLLAALFVAPNESPAPPDAHTSAATADAPTPTAAESAATLPPRDLWADLESDDPATLTDQLRAAGFDEKLVRLIVWSRMSAADHAAGDEIDNAPYWRRRAVSNDINRRNQMERNRGQRGSEVAAFKALFGENPYGLLSPDYHTVYGSRNGLSADVNDRISNLRQQRDEARGSRSGRRYVNGEPDEATRALLAREEAANEQFEAALRAQLTPAEFETYLRTASDTANMLRSRAGVLDLNQAEFDAITQIFGPAADFRSALDQHAAALTDALGEDRYAEFAQSVQGDFQINRFVERMALPASTAIALQGIRDDILDRSRALNRDRTASAAEKQAQRTALGTEASDRLAATLSPEDLELYLDYAGSWLNGLQGPPSRTPGP